jgi:hypothetical protein
MSKCTRCNNQLDKDGSCPYCIWKGDEGPGKQLKEIIKNTRNKKLKEK